MTGPAGDLASLLGPAPRGMSQPMGYLQGTVLSWDPDTLANTIDVGGSTLTDVPVLGVGEADLISAGSVVGLMVVGSTWAIMGRLVIPGSAEATDVMTHISQRIYAATVATPEATTSTSYTDLATVGPSVTARIRASGRALVILSTYIASQEGSGAMGFEASGANTIATSSTRSLSYLGATVTDTAQWSLGAGRMILLEGLTAGDTTFTAKYIQNTGASPMVFADRSIIVYAL